MKNVITLDDAYDDFGFSTISEDELKSKEQKLTQDAMEASRKAEEIEQTYKKKVEQLYKAVIPLLNNLKKDPEKEYLYWPNRVEKIDEFIKKIDKIVK
jgi:uncharacterized protein (UPF0305 family)